MELWLVLPCVLTSLVVVTSMLTVVSCGILVVISSLVILLLKLLWLGSRTAKQVEKIYKLYNFIEMFEFSMKKYVMVKFEETGDYKEPWHDFHKGFILTLT